MSDMERQNEFASLQRLLASKRTEIPSQEYFDGFLAEFHKRQRVELLAPRSIFTIWREQLSDLFTFEPLKAYSYSLASVTAVVICLFVTFSSGFNGAGPLLTLQNGKVQDTLSHYLVSSATDATSVLDVDQKLDEMTLAASSLHQGIQAKYVLNDTPSTADAVLAF